MDGAATNKTERRSKAIVKLPYEPQLAKDSESVNELMHTLFNSLQHNYHQMFEHGLLGRTAFDWLTESIGQGVDCANSERGAMRASSYNRDASDRNLHARKFIGPDIAGMARHMLKDFASN